MFEAKLKSIIEGREITPALMFVDNHPEYKNYWMLKENWRLMVYVFGTLIGMGKQREPMVEIDPALKKLLNKQNYFSSSIGKIWTNQQDRIYDHVNIGINSTVLFADGYNIQKAKMKVGLWTLDFNPLYNDSVDVTAIFGHVHVLPMLPYEIIGAATIIWDFAQTTGMKINSVSWMFHSIDGKTMIDEPEISDPETRLLKVPNIPTAKDYFAAESFARSNPFVRPMPDTPSDTTLLYYLDSLITWYRSKHNASSTLDEINF